MPYEDVLDAIEQVRLSKWKERHVRISTGHTLTRRPAGSGTGTGGSSSATAASSGGGGLIGSSVLPTSHSQPLYVPGKYLVSSKVHFDFLQPFVSLRHAQLIRGSGSRLSSNSCRSLCMCTTIAAIELSVQSRGERDLQLHAERFGQSDGAQCHRLEVGAESEWHAAQLSRRAHQFLLRLFGNR